ncbi:heterokaryon incompatibility domain-containing protein [Trichoderma sp. SZMC 28013]
MPLENASVLYTDDGARFGGREYPGCFSINEVRQRLGQPLLDPVDASAQHVWLDVQGEMVAAENHFLPNCACAAVHAACGSLCDENGDPIELVDVELSLKQLCESSEAGCWFCTVIYGGIMAAPPWDPELKAKRPSIHKSISIIDKVPFELRDLSISVFTHLEDSRRVEPELLFYVDEDEASESPCQLFRRRKSLFIDPHTQLAFIKSNLQDCSLRHSHPCTPSTSSFMPTRFLHISVDDGKYSLRLVEGIAPQPYVTLSHCWGKSFPANAKTTTSNYSSRKLRIPWADLTQNFRDAVAVTERLGFRYLWIDALCILQDSTSDWASEASRMSDVFSSCALMLSADAAAESNVGFFRWATLSINPWRPLQYARTHAYEMLAGFPPASKLEYLFPLATRAWCFQENRMSHRVAHFAVDEVLWDCTRGDGVCQCGSGNGILKILNDWMERADTTDYKLSCWLLMVQSYSARDLTFWTDRLPALSGLAKRFMVKDSDNPAIKQNFDEIDLGTYLAGNWSNLLMGCLHWYSDPLPGRRLNTTTTYVAPSWSWASVSGAVHFSAAKPCVEIISACCYPAGSDNEGQVTGGELILKAKILPAKLFRSEWTPKSRSYGATKCQGIQADVQNPATGKWEDAGPYHPDFIEPTPEARFAESGFERVSDLLTELDGEYFAMPLAESFGLILKAVHTQKTNTFERTGSISSKCFWREAEPEDSLWTFTGGWGRNPKNWRIRKLPEHLFENVKAQIIKII